jgi:uncharacterized protein (TIGR04222 family)
MRSDHAQLLVRIESFDLDANAARLPFAARLARENGWSRRYADRVISEYKRFVYLAMTTDTPVCPSEGVDAAWHLHLTYTRSYWKRFCDETLGRPLHHEPTRGGPDEHAKHLDMYGRTLARYREAFGHDAPRDIWPAASQRFSEDLAHRSVNTSRNWVIPKGPVKRVAKLAALFAAVAVLVPGCNGGFNPFELRGADFLYFLVPIMIAAVCLGRIVRSYFHGPPPDERDEVAELTREQAAYLSGGSARLTSAVVARLVASGVAAVEGARLVRGGRELDDLTPAERAVRNALPFSNDSASLKPVAKAVEAAFADDAKQLEEAGYLLPRLTQFGAVMASLVPLIVVLLAFVLPRFVTGFANGKATQYLGFTAVVGTLFSLGIIFYGHTRRTRRGEHVLSQLQARHGDLRADTGYGDGYDAGLAVALFGTAVLAGTSVAFLHDWYPRQVTGDGGCGTGGCGAGGDGGGGCGGGGCGGCGGGD